MTYLALRSKLAGSVPVVLSDHEWLSKGLLDAILGSPGVEPLMASSIDQHPVKVGEREVERVFPIEVDVVGADHADLVGKLKTLGAMVRDVQKHGGWLRFRPTGGWPVELEVQHLAASDWWSHLAEAQSRQRVMLQFVCSPYALGDPMDVNDTFDADTFGVGGKYNNGGADWTVSSLDAVGDPAVSGGALVTASTTGLGAWLHSGTPNRYGDAQVTARMLGSAYGSSWAPGFFLKYVDASNYIRAQWRSTSGTTTGVMELLVVVGGVSNTRATEAITLPAAGTYFWGRARIEGNVLFAEYFTFNRKPGITDTPTVAEATPYVLTTAEAAVLGSGVTGQVGLIWNTVGAGTISYDEFDVQAFTYRSRFMPDAIPLHGQIAGNVDALVAVTYSALVGSKPTWLAVCPVQRVRDVSLIWNGDFDVISGATGWVVTAVAGVIAAATSITRVTTAAFEGDGSGQIVTPATTDTGASFAIRRKFRKGTLYTAKCMVRADSGTTSVRVKLGVSGNLGTGTASALSTAWSERTVTWTPTADTDIAYFAVGVNAATATTFEVDRVMVYEGTVEPEFWRGGEPPIGVLQAENSMNATVTTSAGYLGGQSVDGQDPSAQWRVVTGKLDPDPHSGLVAVDVLVLVGLPSTLNAAAKMYALSSSAVYVAGSPTQYSVPHGTTGRSIAQFRPSSGTVKRLISLGTLYLRPNTLDGHSTIIVGMTDGGAVTSKLDAVFLFRSNRLAHTMGGVATADTTGFLGAPSASESKRINEDLSTNVWFSSYVVPEEDQQRSGPLFGARLRLPPGDAGELLVLNSSVILDRVAAADTVDTTVEYTNHIQVGVRPRFLLSRGDQ